MTWSARTPCALTIPSCSTGKVHFLIINVLNDCCICMCFHVYVCETHEERIFPKNSESVILAKTVQAKS